MVGKQSLQFENTPYITDTACIVGEKEGSGPLGPLFDYVEQDPMFGMDNWEEAESQLQKNTIQMLLKKASLSPSDIRYLFAGDLLAQLIATSFGLLDFNIPLFGLFGACSTFGEAISLADMTVNAGYADKTVAVASSHYASAEKQFRFPLEYGNQKTLSSTWTVTGCGAVVVGSKKSDVKITGITTGKIVDLGVKDSMNMGACMAPSAADVIYNNFKDFEVDENYYDKIITGDLGEIGQKLLIDLLKEKGYDISNVHMDCGIEIFNKEKQDTNAGGSGCGCSAAVFCSYIMKNLKKKVWKRILLIPTGALMSTVSYNEGKSVPGIAHGVIIEVV